MRHVVQQDIDEKRIIRRPSGNTGNAAVAELVDARAPRSRAKIYLEALVQVRALPAANTVGEIGAPHQI